MSISFFQKKIIFLKMLIPIVPGARKRFARCHLPQLVNFGRPSSVLKSWPSLFLTESGA